MTIRAEKAFVDALKAHAEGIGKSLNQTVQDLLSPVIGLDEAATMANPLMKVCGVVSKRYGKAIMSACVAQRQADLEMWR